MKNCFPYCFLEIVVGGQNQRLKVDQFFRGFFRDFPTLIKLKYIQK